MSRRSFILFLKAMCSAQIASAVDFMATLALVNFCGLYYVYATFLGALSGGVVNCCINYKWVFCVSSSKCHIALKYMLVWGGEHHSQYLWDVFPYRVYDAYSVGRPAD